ncbi:MAG: L-fucose mutarotase [Clostridiales bacterium]|nr:L-fucose mutarotase [Clostridiales bacterium]
MLRGIPTEISPDLLHALACTGHGDLIVIADDFYPPYSKSPNAITVFSKGNTAGEMVDAILKLVPLDVDYVDHPVLHMIPDADSGVTIEGSKAWEDVFKAVESNGYSKECIGTIERSKFYEMAARAAVTVCTSERLPYGCFILQKGVL